MKIVICDDEVVQRFRYDLSDNGINKLYLVKSYFGLLDVFSENNDIDLLIIDAQFKDFTGVSLSYILRIINAPYQVYHKPERILITTICAEKLPNAAFDAAIKKPYERKDFNSMVRKLLSTTQGMKRLLDQLSDEVEKRFGLPRYCVAHYFYRDALLLAKEDPYNFNVNARYLVKSFFTKYLMAPSEVFREIHKANLIISGKVEEKKPIKRSLIVRIFLFFVRLFKKLFSKKIPYLF